MLRRDKKYKRLPGGGRSMLMTSSYWLGSDHLLAVHVEAYVEKYRRFYYRDIQAIIVRRTARAAILNVTFGLAAAATVIIAAKERNLFWVVAAGLGFLPLLGNLLPGPTCVCHVRTAVQTTQLTGMKRLRTVRRALAQLRPLIESAQTTLIEPTAPDIIRGDRTPQSSPLFGKEGSGEIFD